ncbi:MAG TPA: hypothetical protein VH329_02925 [Solirubrobacterales bacterium]
MSFWIAVGGAVIAIAVIVALIVTWPNHGDSSTKTTGAAPASAKQSGSAVRSAAATGSADVRP